MAIHLPDRRFCVPIIFILPLVMLAACSSNPSARTPLTLPHTFEPFNDIHSTLDLESGDLYLSTTCIDQTVVPDIKAITHTVVRATDVTTGSITFEEADEPLRCAEGEEPLLETQSNLDNLSAGGRVEVAISIDVSTASFSTTRCYELGEEETLYEVVSADECITE